MLDAMDHKQETSEVEQASEVIVHEATQRSDQSRLNSASFPLVGRPLASHPRVA
jgi:hypothetical protein